MKFTHLPAFVIGRTYHDDVVVTSTGKYARVYKRRGRVHRDDGPAIQWADGKRVWCRHNHIHRDDGPAVEAADGTKEWWLKGQPYAKPKWLREVLNDRPLTTHQREFLHALSENRAGTPDALYETVTLLSPEGHDARSSQ